MHGNRNKKVAVVTGSSSGIGFETSLLLAKNGFFTYATMRNLNKSQGIIDLKHKEKLPLEVLQLDVTDDKSVKEAIGKIANERETIDVLVNNAGIQKDIPLTETTLQDWYNIISVDLTGPFICSREAVRQMKVQNDPRGGCIINISSVHQIIPRPHYVAYATSKGGIEMMTKTMALELATDNIRVNIVAPGAIDTDMNINLRTNVEERENTLRKIPMGRIGKDEEVANVVEFLASHKASYITGSTVIVDGGMTLYPSFILDYDHNSIHIFPKGSM